MPSSISGLPGLPTFTFPISVNIAAIHPHIQDKTQDGLCFIHLLLSNSVTSLWALCLEYILSSVASPIFPFSLVPSCPAAVFSHCAILTVFYSLFHLLSTLPLVFSPPAAGGVVLRYKLDPLSPLLKILQWLPDTLTKTPTFLAPLLQHHHTPLPHSLDSINLLAASQTPSCFPVTHFIVRIALVWDMHFAGVLKGAVSSSLRCLVPYCLLKEDSADSLPSLLLLLFSSLHLPPFEKKHSFICLSVSPPPIPLACKTLESRTLCRLWLCPQSLVHHMHIVGTQYLLTE